MTSSSEGTDASRWPHLGRRLPRAALLMVAVFSVIAVSGGVELADSDPPRLPPVIVTLGSRPPRPIPRSYFGLSTEYWALPLYARHLGVFERVLGLLRVPHDGPMILRVGGDSADHSFWDPRRARLPSWAFTLSRRWTSLTSGIVRSLDLRLIIDLNLITDSPSTAAGWAQAAESHLPRHRILAFEIGNEPDIYSHRSWMKLTAGELVGAHPLPPALTPSDYRADFRAYAEALHRVAPHLALAGPALAYPRIHASWLRLLLANPPTGLGLVTVHRYPYSACLPARSASSPTVGRILSARASLGLARQLAPMIDKAHGDGLPFRLTELNSVNCGGRGGVSNTFATALWAPDTLFALLAAQADGANIHVRANAINSPFALTRHGLLARPLLYGLILFVRTLGEGHQLIPVNVRASRGLAVHAWAVRTDTGALHVLLLDKGRRRVRVFVRVRGSDPASEERLLAGSASARFGVTLDGQHLGLNGAWLGRPKPARVNPTRRGYVLSVSRWSAALLDISAPESATRPG